MKKLFYYHHNNKPKDLKRNIDFKFVIQNCIIFYFAYCSFILALVTSSPFTVLEKVSYLGAIFYPLPLFLIFGAILVEIDDRRTLSNYKLQSEIKRVKNMYEVRKKTEEILNGSNEKQ